MQQQLLVMRTNHLKNRLQLRDMDIQQHNVFERTDQQLFHILHLPYGRQDGLVGEVHRSLSLRSLALFFL